MDEQDTKRGATVKQQQNETKRRISGQLRIEEERSYLALQLFYILIYLFKVNYAHATFRVKQLINFIKII